jgi:hypothetical protein
MCNRQGSMHRSASFARARFTITKSDWPAINLGRNLCRWAYHDGTYSYVKELRGQEMLGGRPMQPKGG